MEPLTRCTVAVLALQGLVPAQLVLNTSAVTPAVPLGIKVVGLVDLIWFPMLPLVLSPMCGCACLKLMGFAVAIAIATLGRHSAGEAGVVLVGYGGMPKE